MSTGVVMPEARYERVARRLREQIERGDLAPGALLPTQSALQAEYGISASTARQAMAALRAEGLVVTEQGRGTFVRTQREQLRMTAYRYRRHSSVAPHRREAEHGGWAAREDFIADRGTATASTDVARRLRIEPGDPVSEAEYTRLVEGEPVQFSVQWEPLALTRGTTAEVPGGGELGDPSVIDRMEAIERPVTEVTEVIRSRMPNPGELRTLDLPAGIPVLVIERTHWSRETPVETADIVIRADRLAIENVIEVS